MSFADEQKRAVGEAAAKLVENGMIVGLGTGSTAVWFVRALAQRMQDEKLDVRGVATSSATQTLAEVLAIPMLELNQVQIDLTVDGADEIGPGLQLIKGAGAAPRSQLTRASQMRRAVASWPKRTTSMGSWNLPSVATRLLSSAITTQRREDSQTSFSRSSAAPAPLISCRPGPISSAPSTVRSICT